MKRFLTLMMVIAVLCGFSGTALAEEPVHLIWWLFTVNDVPADWPEVEAAMNEISQRELGVTCEFKFFNNEQINRAVQVGEYFDIAFTCDWFNDYATNVSNGMFLELTDLLNEYGQQLLVDLPEDIWEGVKVNGGIYGVPHLKDYAYDVFWILRSKFFEDELGLIPEEHKQISIEEMETYLAKYKEMYPDDYPIKVSRGGLTSWSNCLVDWLSMNYYIGLDWDLQGTAEQYTVKCALDVPRFVDRLKVFHSWYEKGYINPDAAVIDSMPRVTRGVVQSGQGWFGYETMCATNLQDECFVANIEGPSMNSSSIRGAISAICAYSEHPVEAMQLINLMNTNQEYRTLATFGIEGKHYEVVEPGVVRRTELGIQNMNNNNYVHGSSVLCPLEASQFEGMELDTKQYENMIERYETQAEKSVALGFSFDVTPVVDQCLALASVWSQYINELQTGTSDPEVVIPQLKAELEAVGLNDVLAECQAQLDAFIALKAA
ncbi:MAG: ABC transporter substrate-binding protein [Christensenellales bacterium]|nr:ABC transporter substrate-binding protein [Christensenellales bacterium]